MNILGIDPGGVKYDYTGMVGINYELESKLISIKFADQFHCTNNQILDIIKSIKPKPDRIIIENNKPDMYDYLKKHIIDLISCRTVGQSKKRKDTILSKLDITYWLRNKIYNNEINIPPKYNKLHAQIQSIDVINQNPKASRNRHDDIYLALILALNPIFVWETRN